MGYLDHIHACNNANLSQLVPFIVDGQRVGWLRPEFAFRLADWPNVFEIDEARVTIVSLLDNFDCRSSAVAPILRALATIGLIDGWRDELYPVMPIWGGSPLLQMERAAVPHFGVRAWGVHMNGFVCLAGGLHMWVATRSRNKPTYPGMLDNTVAGGQPIGITPLDNLIKECDEEAGIPKALAQQARSVGVISYCHETLDGAKPDQMFCYDLEMPADFTPVNTDGEIDGFELWPIEQVAECVRDSFDFKFNCNLAIIDFLIRHGIITPENEPDYIEIALGLRLPA